MRKNKKLRLFLLLIVLALLIIGCASFFPLIVMSPVATGQIENTNIIAVRQSMNSVFFVKTYDGYILIDAGSNERNLERALQSVNINVNNVKWILLTHSDSDHVGALNLFPNAVIHMSKDELPLINGTMNRNRSGGNNMPAGIDIDTIVLLSDGDELFVNDTKVKCISAPGHTPGSMLYLIDDKYLFTGDAFMIRNRNISVHPFTIDSELSKETIERLRTVINNTQIVLTSHYGKHFNN